MRGDLLSLDRHLRRMLQDKPTRPFLCSGSPYGCDVAIVGINPGTGTSFWEHWSVVSGFDKESWLHAYGQDPRNTRNQTRPRIEILVKALAPVRVVELNLYPYATKREAELEKVQRDASVFTYLLGELMPRFLFVFGKTPAMALAQHFRVPAFDRGKLTSVQLQGQQVHVLADTHLSRGWSYARVRQLASIIRDHLQQSAA